MIFEEECGMELIHFDSIALVIMLSPMGSSCLYNFGNTQNILSYYNKKERGD